MAAPSEVNLFVREALANGRSRSEIQEALDTAGWSGREISNALSGFADVDFTPPVPRPRQQVTARDAFIYALLFTALCFAAGYLISLIHAVLDLWLPDPVDGNYRQIRATRSVHWAIAALVVSVPVFLWVTVHINRMIEKDASHRRSPVRKWLTYIALFLSAFVFFGDATYVIYHFLQGEMTWRFVLKALAVAGIAAAVFGFYVRDVEETRNDG